MKRILFLVSGFVLLLISIFGFSYFKNYRGSLIPYPILWQALSIAGVAISGCLIFLGKRSGAIRYANQKMGEIEALRKKAIQIPIDAEKCEFKNGSYVELKNEDESNVFSRKSMYTSLDAPATVTVVKSYFIFTTEINETPVRFFSPSYALDPVTLKLRVMKGQISLYVDRLDHSKYYFE